LRGDPYHPSTHDLFNKANDCPVDAAELFELGGDSNRGEIEEATVDPLSVDATPTTWKCKIPCKRKSGLGRTIHKRRRKSTEELSYPQAVTPLPPMPCLPKPKVLAAMSQVLMRKIRHMESQATIVNNRVIDLETAVWEKDGIINKQHKHNIFLKEKMTNDKRASNLVSIPCSFSLFHIVL
jgi:hypothetical protein